MDEIRLSLSQAGPTGELSIIRVDGVVDTITASELERAIEGLVNQRKYNILIDLGGVEYISSAGWGIFISRIQEIRNNSGDIKLAKMIPNVYEIYELLEFENIISAFDSLDQGKKAFNLAPSADSAGRDRIWKTNEKIIPEPGMAIQTAMSPGTRNPNFPSRDVSRVPKNDDELIIKLVVDDPFSTISELRQQVLEADQNSMLGWWKIFFILRRNKLLSRRARFRLARRRSRN